MNFFEYQAQAKRSSTRLVALLLLAVVLIVLAVDAAVLLTLGVVSPSQLLLQDGFVAALQQHAGALAWVSVATIVLIAGASAYKLYALRAGGAVIARQLGGKEVTADVSDPALRRLRNVVEEIAIAACVPVPAIFVLEDEDGINAFAAGYSPNDAAIAVTRGALTRLNRDELQGVIAHEFSHILHGDMRLNLQLMGLTFGILVIGVAGRKLLEHGRGSRDSKHAAPLLVMALALTVIGYVGVFCARVLKAGVSRSRELLADATAVQFTRQSQGLAGALKKVAGLAAGSRLQSARSVEVSHMLFGDSLGGSRWLASHPPLLQRIQLLEPGFIPSQLERLRAQWLTQPPQGLEEDRALGLHADSAATSDLPAPATALQPVPAAVAAQVAQPGPDDFRRAVGLHEAMPERLLEAAHSREQAMPLLLALLLHDDHAVRARQLGEVAVELGEDIAESTEKQLSHVGELHPMLRLPLAALAFPALRRLPRSDLHRFVRCADVLVHLDGKVGLFEYCLSRLLQTQVIEALDPARYRPSGKRKLAQCKQSLADLFGTIAAYGHDDPDAMRRAYIAGLLVVLPQERFELAPPKQWHQALDRALRELDGLDAAGKQLLVQGLVVACSHDGRITLAEAELLRTVCACLHCPLPAVLEQRRQPR